MRKKSTKFQWVNLFMTGLIIFLCVSISKAQDLPAHWEHDDIGEVLLNGDATFADSVFTVFGSGADIWGTADGLHFAYQPSLDDCEITAYIDTITPTSHDAKACVMIRETLDAGSKFAMTVACPGPGVGTYFQRRPKTDAECDHDNLNHGFPAPVGVRLVREGNTFTAFYSEDGGETWLPEKGVSTEIEMAPDAFIGLGVCGKAADGTLCETKFSKVVVVPGIEYEDPIEAINELTASELSFYPNPVTDIVTLEISENYIAANNSVSIFNNVGQLVRKENVNSSQHLMNLSDIPQGLYFIELKNDQGSVVKKLIKK